MPVWRRDFKSLLSIVYGIPSTMQRVMGVHHLVTKKQRSALLISSFGKSLNERDGTRGRDRTADRPGVNRLLYR